MSNIFKRRRRRSGSTSARFKPSLVVPVDAAPARLGTMELAASGAVVIVAIALIGLIWMVAGRTVEEQQAEIRDRASQALVAQAATMAETVGHELQMVDQSLMIIQAAWKRDSDSVNLVKWQQQMPALTAVADDLFICDDQHIIRQDTLPQAVGQGVGSAYVTFPHGTLEQYQADGTLDKDSLVIQGDGASAPIDARQFLMYLIRPLDHPRGWLVGASFRSTELTRLFAQAALGFDPVVALVDSRRGIIQAVVGPAARRPRTDISKTSLFGLMTRSLSGTWIGQTGIDDVERLHAFHRVPGRDMVVLVGANLDEVMGPANTLAAGAYVLALVASALVLAIAATVFWELYTFRINRRRNRILDRNRGELERLRTEETGTTARARLNASRLQVVLDSIVDGIALFDSSLRLVQWNHPFLRGIGVQPRKDMPLDALLRDQAEHGLFGPLDDVETEIRRRTGILRAGDTAGLPQPGPGEETLILRGLPIAEGGFILLLNGIASWEPKSALSPSTRIDPPTVPDVVAPAPIEW